MTCRNTPAGSLATTYARRAFGLQDSQCTSLFHELTREYNAGNTPAVTATHYSDSILSMYRNISLRHDLWPDGSNLLTRAIARIESALAVGLPSNPGTAWAIVNMHQRSQSARDSLNNLFRTTSASTGIPLEDVTSEFNRLYNEYQNGMTYRRRGLLFLPTNPATHYAVDKISQWIRCPSCNKGRYLGVEDPTHGNCLNLRNYLAQIANHPLLQVDYSLTARQLFDINSITIGMVENTVNPLGEDQLISISENAVTVEPKSESPKIPFKGSLPWEVEEFQKSYDEARTRINQQNYLIPANLELETIPGGVTGGLGAKDGGNSFGVEIEIDFPNDEYPYSARYKLARKLHEEGIARYSDVAGWHYVGPGRDGGNFTFGSNDWICEFDRTVDNVDGERGVEIKSQIMFDEPETWRNLRRVCEIATELGGKPTQRTGLHVNVGGLKFPKDDPAIHNSLLRLVATYDDTILRLAHNPLSGPTHRGRRYCQPVQIPPNGFANVRQAKAYANHYQAFNLNHLPGEGDRHQRSSRVEVRVWDSTLDPVRIQTAITLSLALVQGGIDQIPPGGETELAGAHHAKQGGRRLNREAWESSTESFRHLVSLVSDLGAKTEWHKESLTTMFASSKWQSGENYYSNDGDDDDRDDSDDN